MELLARMESTRRKVEIRTVATKVVCDQLNNHGLGDPLKDSVFYSKIGGHGKI